MPPSKVGGVHVILTRSLILPSPNDCSKKLKKSQCTPLFMAAYRMRGQNVVLFPGCLSSSQSVYPVPRLSVLFSGSLSCSQADCPVSSLSVLFPGCLH